MQAAKEGGEMNAEAGAYLIASSDPTFLDGNTIPSGVAFVAFLAETDGVSNWYTLCGNVVTGDLCVIQKIERGEQDESSR